MHIARWAAGLVAGVLVAAGAWAQTPPEGAQDILTVMRAKSSFTDEERSALRSWIDEHTSQLRGDNDVAAVQALTDVRQALSAGTPAFRELLVGGLLDATRQTYKDAKPAGAARLMALAASLNEPVTAGLLIEALKDSRPGVRTAGAAGLRALRSKLAGAGGNALGEALSALREAARSETSVPALRAMYGAMNYADVAGGPDARQLVGIHLDVLEARLGQISGGLMRAEGADMEGIETLGRQLAALGDEEKKRYTIVLATLLRYSVTRYATELYEVKDKTSSPAAIEARNAIELLIESIETQLPGLLGTAERDRPSVLNAIKTMKPDSSDRVNLKIEMNKWSVLLEKATGQAFRVDETIEEEPAAP